MRRHDVISGLQRLLPELRARYGVSHLLLFGSIARGDDTQNSDIDLLVEFDRPVSLFGLASLKAYLERELGGPVDVGTVDSLRPQYRDEVLAEALRVA